MVVRYDRQTDGGQMDKWADNDDIDRFDNPDEITSRFRGRQDGTIKKRHEPVSEMSALGRLVFSCFCFCFWS